MTHVYDWRKSHAWLRGWSDAERGKERNPAVAFDAAEYEKGYAAFALRSK